MHYKEQPFLKTGTINNNIDIYNLIEEAKEEYAAQGFYIAKNLIDNSWYKECRNIALEYFTNLKKKKHTRNCHMH